MEPRPRSGELSPKALLLPVLIDIHRQAAMANFAAHGFEITEWDTDRANAIEDEIDRREQKGQGTHEMFDHVKYDESARQVTRRGVESRLTYPGTILGYQSFSLRESITPLVFKNKIWSGKIGDTGWTFANAVDQPVKVLAVSLHREPVYDLQYCDDKLWANIFLAPDMPPTAIHGQDLLYVSDRSGIDDEDIRIIPVVFEMFGPEAVDYLSDTSCTALIAALEQAEKTVYKTVD